MNPTEVTDITPEDDLKPVGPVVLVVLDTASADADDVGTVEEFRTAGKPVVFIHQGTQVPADAFRVSPDEYLIRKLRWSAFFGTELDLVLKGYRAQTVLFIGGVTDFDLHFSALDAHQTDYHIRTIVESAHGTTDDTHEAALRAIKYLQRDALVSRAAVHSWLAAA
jgi:nicotinamidase-related amidase